MRLYILLSPQSNFRAAADNPSQINSSDKYVLDHSRVRRKLTDYLNCCLRGWLTPGLSCSGLPDGAFRDALTSKIWESAAEALMLHVIKSHPEDKHTVKTITSITVKLLLLLSLISSTFTLWSREKEVVHAAERQTEDGVMWSLTRQVHENKLECDE